MSLPLHKNQNSQIAFLTRETTERREEGYGNEKGDASREMVTQVREEVKEREKAITKRLPAEEGELFLGEHPETREAGSTGDPSLP